MLGKESQAGLPTVAYTKVTPTLGAVCFAVFTANALFEAIDIWTGTCVAFVFCALLEVVAVHYLTSDIKVN